MPRARGRRPPRSRVHAGQIAHFRPVDKTAGGGTTIVRVDRAAPVTASAAPHEQCTPIAAHPPRRASIRPAWTAEDCERSHRRILRRVWAGFASVGFGLAVMMWSADVISFEDERTIYTAECQGGDWTEGRCTGRLKAADRIRFHASKDRDEVVFWKIGAPHQVERLAPCAVQDGRNWSCAPAGDGITPVPLAPDQGPCPARPGRQSQPPLHVIKKWRWWMLKVGVPV